MEIKQVFPVFEEGRLLKKEALDLIRDYAPEYFSLLFESCGDGILAGFRIREAEGRILVGPGILKHGPGFLCMTEEAGLVFDRYGQTTQIVVKKTGSSASHDFKSEDYQLSLGPVSGLENGSYELGRFRLEKGARLRKYGEYKDFHDLVTEYNTLNLIHVRYSCEGGDSFLPLILKLYGKGVIASPKADPLDLSFAVTCLNSPRISGELIKNYLNARERTGVREDSHMEWYQGLKRLYTRLAGGGEIRRTSAGLNRKTVID